MSLEDKVQDRESHGFIRKAGKLAFLGASAIGTTAWLLSTVGAKATLISGLFAGGGLLGRIKKGMKSKYELVTNALREYSIINAVLYPVIKLGDITYPMIGAIGQKVAGTLGSIVSKSAYALTAYNAAFIAMYNGLNHLFSNYLNPIGIISSIKHNFGNVWKRIALIFSPGYLLTANSINEIFGIPVFPPNAGYAGWNLTSNPVPEKIKRAAY